MFHPPTPPYNGKKYDIRTHPLLRPRKVPWEDDGTTDRLYFSPSQLWKELAHLAVRLPDGSRVITVAQSLDVVYTATFIY